MKLEQESPRHDEHCLEVIFFKNEQSTTPQSSFGEGKIIINLSGQQSISSDYPIAQTRFPRRGEFRQGFDIVAPPFLPDLLASGNLSEQFDVLHSKRSMKVSFIFNGKLPHHSVPSFCIHRSAYCHNTKKSFRIMSFYQINNLPTICYARTIIP